jgi:AbrB family looped-hinge helix DNA binding protein
MNTTTLSSKGQVILPKEVRDARQWKPGTKFTVEPVENGVLLRPLKRFPPTKIEDLIGFLKYKGKPKTLRQMDDAITQEVRARLARGRY